MIKIVFKPLNSISENHTMEWSLEDKNNPFNKLTLPMLERVIYIEITGEELLDLLYLYGSKNIPCLWKINVQPNKQRSLLYGDIAKTILLNLFF